MSLPPSVAFPALGDGARHLFITIYHSFKWYASHLLEPTLHTFFLRMEDTIQKMTGGR